MKDKDLIKKASLLKPVVRIGKNGITEPMIEEIKKNLKKKKLIKIKILRSCIEAKDKKTVIADLSSKVDARVIQIVGFTVVLYKDRN